MRKLEKFLLLTVFLSLAVLRGQATASPDALLNWGSQVNPGQCDGANGDLVVNITHQVTNDVDSAVGGGVWAFDEYNKHVQIWQVGADTFCADVRYLGSFTTIAGKSPQGTDTIAAGIEGTFEGGYIGTIVGTLNPSPAKRKRGNVGSFNYACTASDSGGHETCTGLFSWLSTYFSSASFSFDWWGWIYHAGNNGTWVNSSDGNQGDITD